MAIPSFSPTLNIRKRIQVLMLILTSVCALLAVVAGFRWTSNRKILEKFGKPDISTLTQEEIREDMIVTGTIQLVIDCYAEGYKTESGEPVSGSEALYYIVPVCDTNADGTFRFKYFVTYQAKSGDYDIMGDLIAQTWSDAPLTASLSFDYAKVGRIPDELQALLKDWMNDKTFYEHGSFIDWCIEYGIFDTTNRSTIASKLTSCMITRTGSFGMNPAAVFIFSGLAVLFLGIFFILQFVKAPIKGVEENPLKEDFSKLRELDGQSIEGERDEGSDV